MRKLVRKRSKKAGLPPGTLVHIGERKTETARITVIDYDDTQFSEREIAAVDECFPLKDTPTVSWINIDGIHQTDVIEKIGRRFGLHSLSLEDILNTTHRPKLEDFDDYVFLVLKMIRYGDGGDELLIEQISLVLGPRFVLSFQEAPGDVFEPIRDRLRHWKGRIRRLGADYLAYALLDAVVDSYFAVLERLAIDIEGMEDRLVVEPGPECLADIHKAKTDLLLLRKFVWPLREVTRSLSKGEAVLFDEATTTYLRDVYDHTIQVIDTVETFREMVSGLQDLYLSSVSNRMNEVMKTLTIVATIFIPLTFIAGIYGMNFQYMPELKWHFGYVAAWGVMIVVAVGMVFFFKRRRWL